jgi:DNA (cytosine-5)-methyltransferase 1
MRELSLFSGAGGGLLGTVHLLGWRPVGYVEIDDYCQGVIAARIKDGLLPDAPIFGDIWAFLNNGYAESYQGMADVVTAGFPCQPFSVAGERKGPFDGRNLWPATMECIREVRPRYVFLENVPGILVDSYFGIILGDLAHSGYDCRWRCLSAAEMGAPHHRQRLWIVGQRSTEADAAYAVGEGLERDKCGILAGQQSEPRHTAGRGCGNPWDVLWRDGVSSSDILRARNGVARGVDRVKALGNGQVPAVVAAAWRLLSGE